MARGSRCASRPTPRPSPSTTMLGNRNWIARKWRCWARPTDRAASAHCRRRVCGCLALRAAQPRGSSRHRPSKPSAFPSSRLIRRPVARFGRTGSVASRKPGPIGADSRLFRPSSRPDSLRSTPRRRLPHCLWSDRRRLSPCGQGPDGTSRDALNSPRRPSPAQLALRRPRQRMGIVHERLHPPGNHPAPCQLPDPAPIRPAPPRG